MGSQCKCLNVGLLYPLSTTHYSLDQQDIPPGERRQATRTAELHEPLQAGRVFDLRKLMAMDYPDAKDWSLYYAQSVSVTRFLVEQGPPEKFVKFVQNSQR